MNKYSTTFAILVILSASCSSDNSAVLSDHSDLSKSTYSRFGVFSLRRNSGTVFDALSTFEGAFASFIEREEMVTFDDVLSIYQLPPDSCVTFQQPDDSIGNGGLIPVYNQSINSTDTYLSAGEILNLISANGSWLDVDRGQAPYYEYSNTNPINEPVPASLKLSFPGDSFPEFTNLPIPEVDTISLTAPTEGAILQLDTKFTWIPSALNNSYLRLTAEKLIGSQRYYLDCMATDDGEFQIPDSIQTQLGDLFKDYSIRVSRSVRSTHKNGDSIFFIFHSVGSE